VLKFSPEALPLSRVSISKIVIMTDIHFFVYECYSSPPVKGEYAGGGRGSLLQSFVKFGDGQFERLLNLRKWYAAVLISGKVG